MTWCDTLPLLLPSPASMAKPGILALPGMFSNCQQLELRDRYLQANFQAQVPFHHGLSDQQPIR